MNFWKAMHVMIIGNRQFETDHNTYIMGILNVTPDSFFDGGTHDHLTSALQHTARMIEEGADIIDVGGESTRPGAAPVDAAEETARILPVIKAIRREFDIPLSIDTSKAEVAEAAFDAGADLLNDIWGLKNDPRLAPLAASYQAACCLMHNRKQAVYEDLIADVKKDLKASLEIALGAGISKEKILLDPGIGFAKNPVQNLQMTKEVGKLKSLGYPLLYASSNKSFIGAVLETDVNDRLAGTLATTVWAVLSGCAFVRVHQVKENKQVIQMTKAILGGNTNG